MTDLINLDAETIYMHFKKGKDTKYREKEHCELLIETMLNPNKGTYGSFCVSAMIADSTFFEWVNKFELFRNVYYFSKLLARERWEEEGRFIRDQEYQMGTVNYAFEHWKLIGWSRFGISKNSRIKLNLNPKDSPADHYAAILRQASEGDFTAAEFKQLMESINVGINVHQLFELQKQIDELKSDLLIMTKNKNVKNPFATKGT
jgi:hypothetical protein